MLATDESSGAGKIYTLLGPDRHPYSSAIPGLLGGHRGSKIYGRLDCPAAARDRPRRLRDASGVLRRRARRNRRRLPAVRNLLAGELPGMESQQEAPAVTVSPRLAGIHYLDGPTGVTRNGGRWRITGEQLTPNPPDERA